MGKTTESPRTVGAEIQRLRKRAGLSQPQLGARVYTSRAQISHWEADRRSISPDQLADLDAALDANGQLVEFVAGSSGLSYDPDWTESLRTITNMWHHDVSRRDLIRAAAYSPAAIATTLAGWARPTTGPTETGTRRIGTPEIETIRTVATAFRSLDNRFGGLTSREGVVAFLDTEVGPLLKHGQFTNTAGPALLSAAAEMTHLAGWMSYDSGMHGAAERYFIQSLRLAEASTDTHLAIEILAAMAHQAAHLGHGPEAVQLADTARRAAENCGAHVLAAEAAVMGAHGHAVQGDTSACARLLLEAEQALDRADRAADPKWVSYFDDAYLSAKRGHCLLAVGDHHGAIDAARRSLDMNDDYVRGRMFNLSLLATSLAAAGDPDEACSHGHEALQLTAGMRSVRAHTYLDRLQTELAGYDITAVREFSTAVQQHRL